MTCQRSRKYITLLLQGPWRASSVEILLPEELCHSPMYVPKLNILRFNTYFISDIMWMPDLSMVGRDQHYHVINLNVFNFHPRIKLLRWNQQWKGGTYINILTKDSNLLGSLQGTAGTSVSNRREILTFGDMALML